MILLVMVALCALMDVSTWRKAAKATPEATDAGKYAQIRRYLTVNGFGGIVLVAIACVALWYMPDSSLDNWSAQVAVVLLFATSVTSIVVRARLLKQFEPPAKTDRTQIYTRKDIWR